MKKVVLFIKNLPLFKKMLAAYSLIGIISILCTLLVFSINSIQFIRQETVALAERNVSQVAGSISAKLETADNLSKLILCNNDIQNALRDGVDFESFKATKRFSPLFMSYLDMLPDESGVYVFGTDGRHFGRDMYSYHQFGRIEDTDWYKKVLAQEGYYILVMNGGESFHLNGNTNCISLIRNIYDLNTQSVMLGTLMLNLDETLFTDCFKNMTDQTNLFITVTDANGNSLIANTPVKKYPHNLFSETGIVTFVEPLKRTVYASIPIPGTSWFVAESISYADDLNRVSSLDTVFWVLLIILLLLLVSITLVMNRMITKPIHQLTKAMQPHEPGSFTRLDDDSRKDEIGILKRTYNDMLDRIEEEGKRKRTAELRALQMQVKPHFLYNTIDTARSLVISGKASDANLLLLSLGQFYRDSICGDTEIIPLRNEIDMVKNYLTIQKIRYGKMFEAVYDIDDSLLTVPVLKLIIQPLVENALYHGFRDCGKTGVITIQVKKDEKNICILVTDNGSGIAPEKIAQILSSHEAISGEGVGLCGTIDRLKLYYRLEEPLSIRSTLGYGTCITITIPEECI
jgi:two-component system sensor histidine kinase YesM